MAWEAGVTTGLTMAAEFNAVQTGFTTLDADFDALVADLDATIDARILLADLADLADVVITAPANGHVLTYDFANSRWVNAAPGGISDGDKGDITTSGGGTVWTIDNGVVTLVKMADMATSRMIGRVTAGTGSPEFLTAAQVRSFLNVADGATANDTNANLRDRATHTGTQAASTITGLSAFATGTDAANLTGTVAAARIADASLPLSKLANLATSTILGRATVGSGAPEALSAAQVRTILNVADGATANSADATLLNRANHTGTQAASTITGLAAVATSGSASDLGTGTLPIARIADGAVTLAKLANIADQTVLGNNAGVSGAPLALTMAQLRTMLGNATTSIAGLMSAADKTKLDGVATGANNYSHPNHTGDVTSTGDGATTIAADAVTNSKLANMATSTIKGRATAGTGDPEDLTASQVRTLIEVPKITVGTTAPSSPSVNDIWIDTN